MMSMMEGQRGRSDNRLNWVEYRIAATLLLSGRRPYARRVQRRGFVRFKNDSEDCRSAPDIGPPRCSDTPAVRLECAEKARPPSHHALVGRRSQHCDGLVCHEASVGSAVAERRQNSSAAAAAAAADGYCEYS